MCNSWNHTSDCTCGFGGEGHLGGSSGPRSQSLNLSSYRVTYESYTIPNAKCPVCKEQVYFYQSPYGGRVFFDELGEPWPKHPCTDHSDLLRFGEFHTDVFNDELMTMQSSPGWIADGWKPFTTWKVEVDGDNEGISLVGFLSEYLATIEYKTIRFSDYLAFNRHICNTEIPLINLQVKSVENWFQRKLCIFMIYPTFIKQSSRGEQFYDLSSFVLDKNGQVKEIYAKDAYQLSRYVGTKLGKGSCLSSKRLRAFDRSHDIVPSDSI